VITRTRGPKKGSRSMRPKVVGSDTEQKHNRARWLIVGLVLLVLFIILLTAGHSEAAPLPGGGCTGYTNAEATVIGFWHVPFSHVVTVEIGQDQASVTLPSIIVLIKRYIFPVSPVRASCNGSGCGE
jgi:hypothetical protein